MEGQIVIPMETGIAMVVALAGAIVTLYLAIQKGNKTASIEKKDLYESFISHQREQIESITTVVRDNAHAIEKLTTSVESNTKATDRVYEQLRLATKQ